MIKNAIIYRIAESWQPDLQALEDALQKCVFAECGATQERSVGWVPPRGEEHGLLAESVAGQWMLRFMSQSKLLPASVLNDKVKEKAAHIEKTEGRNPGKKEKRELKDEAKLDLLPMAFKKSGAMWVWIDPPGSHPGAGYQRARPCRRDRDAAGGRPARLCTGSGRYPDQPAGGNGALADDAGATCRLFC